MKKIFLCIFLIVVLISTLFCDQYIFYPIQSYFGNEYTNKKGFRQLGNPNACTNTLTITYQKHSSASIRNFPRYISAFVPPYSKISGVIYFNIDADIGYALRYKNIPKIINPPKINFGYGWNGRYDDLFPDKYYYDYYFKNSGGAGGYIGRSRKISEQESGWLFFEPVYWENGIGILKFVTGIKVDCNSNYKNWYYNIREPVNPFNINFYFNNCVDSNHPELYEKHICNPKEECSEISIFTSPNPEPQVYYYYSKKGNTSNKKYFYCWAPYQKYPDGSIVWDIWANGVYYPALKNSNICDSAHPQYCTTEKLCLERGHGYWYDNTCHKLTKQEECFKDINKCTTVSLCNSYKQTIDSDAYWNGNKCTFDCNENHVNYCHNQDDCLEVGGYWNIEKQKCEDWNQKHTYFNNKIEHNSKIIVDYYNINNYIIKDNNEFVFTIKYKLPTSYIIPILQVYGNNVYTYSITDNWLFLERWDLAKETKIIIDSQYSYRYYKVISKMNLCSELETFLNNLSIQESKENIYKLLLGVLYVNPNLSLNDLQYSNKLHKTDFYSYLNLSDVNLFRYDYTFVPIKCSYTNNNHSNKIIYNPTNFTFNQYIITKDSLKIQKSPYHVILIGKIKDVYFIFKNNNIQLIENINSFLSNDVFKIIRSNELEDNYTLHTDSIDQIIHNICIENKIELFEYYISDDIFGNKPFFYFRKINLCEMN